MEGSYGYNPCDFDPMVEERRAMAREAHRKAAYALAEAQLRAWGYDYDPERDDALELLEEINRQAEADMEEMGMLK